MSKLIIENEGGKTVNIRGAGIKDQRKFEEKKKRRKERNLNVLSCNNELHTNLCTSPCT